MTIYKNIINGDFVDGDMGSQPIFNPATGEETGSVMLSGAAVVDQAVAAAKAALPAWANLFATPRQARGLSLTPSTQRCSSRSCSTRERL